MVQDRIRPTNIHTPHDGTCTHGPCSGQSGAGATCDAVLNQPGWTLCAVWAPDQVTQHVLDQLRQAPCAAYVLGLCGVMVNLRHRGSSGSQMMGLCSIDTPAFSYQTSKDNSAFTHFKLALDLLHLKRWLGWGRPLILILRIPILSDPSK